MDKTIIKLIESENEDDEILGIYLYCNNKTYSECLILDGKSIYYSGLLDIFFRHVNIYITNRIIYLYHIYDSGVSPQKAKIIRFDNEI